MFRFNGTYCFISRGTEQLVPQCSPCALPLQPKHNWYDNENSGATKVYKRNKTAFRMIA